MEIWEPAESCSPDRGQGPAVYWFNPACELQAAHNRPGLAMSRPVRQLAADFAALPMLLGGPGDVVLVPRSPSPGFLDRLQQAGFPIPEFVEYSSEAEGLARLEIARRQIDSLRPWGWSPDAARFMEALRQNLPAGRKAGWNEGMRQCYSKAWSVELLRDFLRADPPEAMRLCDERVVGTRCASLEEVLERVEGLKREGFGRVVVKAVFGASGQNQVRFGGRISEAQQGWVQNILKAQGGVVVEPWLERVADLSWHLDLSAPGRAEVLGWTWFFTDSRGQYRGSMVRGAVAGMGPEIRGFLGEGLQQLVEAVAGSVAGHAAAAGYTGPVGIDALVHRDTTGLRLKPIVEVNPRFTMGRVALHLGRRVQAGRTALWLVRRRRDIEVAGFADAAEFARHLEARYPVAMGPGGHRISSGVLFTTDPGQARAIVSVLLVGESLEACKGYFEGLPDKLWEWAEYC